MLNSRFASDQDPPCLLAEGAHQTRSGLRMRRIMQVRQPRDVIAHKIIDGAQRAFPTRAMRQHQTSDGDHLRRLQKTLAITQDEHHFAATVAQHPEERPLMNQSERRVGTRQPLHQRGRSVHPELAC